MAINYTTLTAAKTTADSIKEWVNNSTISSTTVLTMAEQEIYKTLRVHEMISGRTDGTGTMTASTEYESLPTDFRWPVKFLITGTDAAEVKLAPKEEVLDAFSYDSSGNRSTGKPTLWYFDETEMHFDVAPDAAYVYRLVYYQTPAALSTATETNFLTTKYPMMLYHACMWAANVFLKNRQDVMEHYAMMKQQIDQANAESQRAANRGVNWKMHWD